MSGDAAFIAAGLSLLAATVHAGLAPEHFASSPLLGAGFAFAAGAQAAWTVAAARAGVGPRLAPAGVALNVAVLGAWLLSRTAGLPLGPAAWVPEPAGALDVLTALAEVSLCGLLAGSGRLLRWAERGGLASAAALVCVLVSGMALH